MIYTNPYDNDLFGNYITRYFFQIFPSQDDFQREFENSPFAQVTASDGTALNAIPQPYIELIYWLLMTNYANSTPKSYDEERFKFNVFSIIFTHGPAWIKRMEVQNRIRALGEEDLRVGSNIINNNALNPGSEPTTEELAAINQQNVSKRKKSILEGYTSLLALIKTDVTSEFINRFDHLFSNAPAPYGPIQYLTYEGEPTE